MSLHGSASRGPPSQSRIDDKTGDTGPILIGVGDDGAGERGAANVGRGDDMNQSQFAHPNDRLPRKSTVLRLLGKIHYLGVYRDPDCDGTCTKGKIKKG